MSLLHSRRAASNLVNGGQTAQVVRRGRRKRVAADEGSFLSLKDFMHRQRVLKQYREFVRTTYKMPSDDASWKSQILTEIRETYRSRMNETDKLSISMAVTDGNRKLSQLKSIAGESRGERDSLNTPDINDDESSWLNTKDEQDVRGRVGSNWPWEKS